MPAVSIGLIISVVQNFVLPEVMTAIRAHFNATGALPTDAEVIAALQLNTSVGMAKGIEWLMAHPE